MNHDQTFRAVLIVVFLVVLPIGIYYRSQPRQFLSASGQGFAGNP